MREVGANVRSFWESTQTPTRIATTMLIATVSVVVAWWLWFAVNPTAFYIFLVIWWAAWLAVSFLLYRRNTGQPPPASG